MLERPGGGGGDGVRISDRERDQAIELLRHHCADGRLTLDEFSDRVGLVYEARTDQQLALVSSDLPAVVQHVPETRRRKVTRWVVGIMGGDSLKGRWRPGERTTAVAFM